MVAPKDRSRKRRRIYRKTPSGKVKVVNKARKPSKASCAGCGQKLHGVANELPVKMRNLPKTAKRPERPYGGMLCSSCAREAILAEVVYASA